VSNAEPRETLIPWGKMSTAYFAARGDVALSEEIASPAWACTGCYACREACDHRNDVAGTLFDARSAFVAAGVGPAVARAVIGNGNGHGHGNGNGVLVGCLYERKLPDVAKEALRVADQVLRVREVVHECCGLPLRMAGDKAGFEAHAKRFEGRELVVVDPGCAMALRTVGVKVTVLVEAVAAKVAELSPLAKTQDKVRWHDPCQLGRGLGIYDAPRAVLTRVLGRAPAEFAMHAARAECSGAGGLLPLTMPETSKAIARKRTSDAEGNEIVTGCASSLLAFRAAGAKASDIVSWMARALERPHE
jgi:Fe-S oxidoreductase